MAMMQPKNKELTVKQYEFYKRKGLADEKIMKMHGYHTASMNAWKKENNLIGVKFETDLKVVEGAVLREKEVGARSVDSKNKTISQESVVKRHNSTLEERTTNENTADKETPTKLQNEQEDASNANIEVPESVTIEPTAKYVEELEERHCKDSELIAKLEEDNECLQRKLKGALARSDENRSETLHEQNKRREEAEEADNRYNALVLETNRRIEKLERAHEIEVANLKHERAMQDKALEKHAEDEKLIALLMKKGADLAERVVSE